MGRFHNGAMASASHPSLANELLRGALPLLILHSLRDGPSYGYAISASLARHGVDGIKGGTLYPLLARHEAAGLVTTQWRPGDGGPGRKYFSLTPRGESETVRLRDEWRQFVQTVEQLFTDKETEK